MTKIVITTNYDDNEGTPWSTRVFDAMSCGKLVLSPYKRYMESLGIKDKEHIIFYEKHDLKDLMDKITYYLANPDEILRIGNNADRKSVV